MSRQRVRAHARAGYTLIELMMIVMIIAVSVLAFTPGFSRAMADRRVGLAARELIRVGRRARADTFGYLRAHLIWLDLSNRRVQLLRGPTNSCALTNWTGPASDCTADGTPSGRRCVENLLLENVSGTSRVISIWEERVVGGSSSWEKTPGRALCFQPSGVMMYGTALGLGALQQDDGTANGGFVFGLLDGADSPNSSNVAQRLHRVLFPLGGSARGLR